MINKRIRRFLCVCVATLTLTQSVFAGEITPADVDLDTVQDEVYSEAYDEAEPFDDVADSEAAYEAADDDIDLAGVSVSGNVSVEFDSIVSDFLYHDQPSLTGERDIAQAKFITAGDGTVASLDPARVYVRKASGTKDYLCNWPSCSSNGLSIEVVGDKLRLHTNDSLQVGSYIFTAYVSGRDDVYAEYPLTVKPDMSQLVIYANKNEFNRTLYTDGKKKLTLSLEAKYRDAGSKWNAPMKTANATYSLAGATQCTLDSGKITIPANFTGKESLVITATAKNKSNVDISSTLNIVVTSTPPTPDKLAVARSAGGVTVYDVLTDGEHKATVSAEFIDKRALSVLDEKYPEADEPLNVTYKVTGPSLKYNAKNNTFEATGKEGVSKITVTSKLSKKTQAFELNVKKYDNTDMKLFYRNQSDVLTPATEEIVNERSTMDVYVKDSVTYDEISPRVGNYKISVKGGKLITNSFMGYKLVPTAAKSTIKYTVDGVTETYNVTNTMYADALPKVKKVTFGVYSDNDARVVSANVAGLPAGTASVKFYEDPMSKAKLKGAKVSTYTEIFSSVNPNAELYDGKKIGLNITSGLSDLTAGKYIYKAVAYGSTGTAVAKPFDVVVTVAKKAPKPSIKLSAKSFKLSKTVGAEKSFTIKGKKNIDAIVSVSARNGYTQKKLNSFTSYFSVVKVNDDEYKIVVTDAEPETKDLNGVLRFVVTMKNGIDTFIDVPVNTAF